MNPPTVGEEFTYERTFTVEEVEQFTELSGDAQPIHTEPDEDGRLMAQGLLTATLPTKIGGDLEVLAHTMNLTFRRPVYTGETITCTWTNEAVDERDDRYEVIAAVVCRNDKGTAVLTATIEGLIWKEG